MNLMSAQSQLDGFYAETERLGVEVEPGTLSFNHIVHETMWLSIVLYQALSL